MHDESNGAVGFAEKYEDYMNQRKAVASSYAGVIAIASIIFIAGGRLLYWQALLYLGLAILGTTLTHVLSPKERNLAAYRANKAKTGESWDRRILGFFFLLNIVTFVVAGLDSGRFGWSGPLPVVSTAIGSVAMFVGQLVFALARRENAFFASSVQIEEDRPHSVCMTGPYSVIRHPGYLGMVISVVGFPLVIGSYWAFVPVALSVITLLLRVRIEDRFLKEKLTGYREYSSVVKYKLIPFIH
jgi:protein-S-isoprenylcysteine O-methyltransferase Ste14